MSLLKTYYKVTKPGIIYGNAITAAAGFFLASQGHPDWWLLLATLVGASLVMASGCVFNNWLDRDIDKKMERTKTRALASGEISIRAAIIYATVLAALGFLILALFVNWLTFSVGLIGLFFYVVVYGIVKRRSVYGTLVGSISGATPIVAGYSAARGEVDIGTLLLFLILATWQMPHFYAIAIYRLKDYAAASIPVWPLKRGVTATKRQMLGYLLAFILACASLTAFGFTGYLYLAVMLLASLAWLWQTLRGFGKNIDDTAWAKYLFTFSLKVLMIFSVLISVAWLTP
jgi:protoheme IX farnesyltransferase